jgi:methylmalonyl-CoA mutase
MAASPISFAGHFDRTDEKTWKRAVESLLRNTDLDSLATITADDILVRPIYQRAATPPAMDVRPAGSPWAVITQVDHPNIEAGNRLALADINGGADGLALIANSAPAGFGFGAPLCTPGALQRQLAGIALDHIQLRLEPGPSSSRIALALRQYCAAEEIDPQKTRVSFGLDPIGVCAARGGLAAPWEVVAQAMAETAKVLAGDGFGDSLVEADGRVYHNSGATPAQELAAVLSTAVCYLRALAPEIGLDRAAAAIGITLAVDADQFSTIAKLRAIRSLWAQVRRSCGLGHQRARIHAQTGWRMMTRRDPHVNLLRTTVAAFAAGVGGADTITVSPFTQALGLPDAFARRLARNIQHILIEESNIHRVGDPASGSGYVEHLTQALARKAWTLFQETERAGGIIATLQSGHLQSLIGNARHRRTDAVATRKQRLTGTTAFPNLGERSVEVLDAESRPGRPDHDGGIQVEPLDPGRDAEPFECLRDKSDRLLADTGERPRVVLIYPRQDGDHSATANWAGNFFATVGIEATVAFPADDVNQMADAFAQSGAKVACLFGFDAAQSELAAAAVTVLHDAGARMILIAGAPLQNSCAKTRYIYEGCAALDILRALYEAIEDQRNPRQ